MQTGRILLFLIAPIVSECCCGKNSNKERGFQQDTKHLYYRAVEGEIFMLPCNNRKVTWFRIGESPGEQKSSFECETKFFTDVTHSGNYTDGNGERFLHLHVVSKASLPCSEPDGESRVMLKLNAGERILCPGFNCSDNSQVTWYKDSKPVSEQNRESCSDNGLLLLCTVSEYDTGVFFCDRNIIERQVHWTYRRSVQVTVRAQIRANEPPHIVHRKTTEEVEIGHSHSLVCQVHFPFELNFSREVQWYKNPGGNMDNQIQLRVDKQELRQEWLPIDRHQVTATTLIDKVTTQHLRDTFTCVASNKAGTNNVTISLRRKIMGKHPCLVGYPVAFLVVVTVLALVLRRNWLELQLLTRTHCQYGKRLRDKEFDVFLSYDSSPTAAEVMIDSPTAELKGCPLISAEPVGFELSRILEDCWGYRLCMTERDLLPGGVYRDDVESAIQRSQMVICVLSPDYLTNANTLYVLESGVQALLKTSIQKLLLIQTSHTPTGIAQVHSAVVHRAMKVLPSLVWNSGGTDGARSSFLKSLRQSLPSQQVDKGSHKQG
ncbi:interleukin-18 receptor accessory protein-like isoform X2 [Synchiropus splendidus]|uniref:interleukin-18 receptor accessory protein-like isoform X2 n=1 Tax=Synchiropus splendidus TaxID=270530 RepID=UPI00237E09A8|nr:interleukin-18 receptor accessory protein-like isoform X2 [Synchiropus splendidus]